MTQGFESGANPNAPETATERATVLQPLCDTILMQGFSDTETTLGLMDWADHPDCTDADFDHIVGVLRERLQAFNGQN